MNMKIYEEITARIIGMLEQGVVPWKRPWNGAESHPKNLVSGKEYRGVNVWMLSCSGYVNPYWLTFNQARELGGSVRKGEKGTPVVFWNFMEVADKKGEGSELKTIPLLRKYTVFNVEQCDNIDHKRLKELREKASEPPRQVNKIEECEKVVAGYANKPEIINGKARACYSPSMDVIHMPDQDRFVGDEEYYSVLFHEMGHSTGHSSRLGRELLGSFGTQSYSKEELVAEMTAAFLCGVAGITPKVEDNQAAYIASWLKRLKDDPKLVVSAAGQAQKASDYILGTTQAEVEKQEEVAAGA